MRYIEEQRVQVEAVASRIAMAIIASSREESDSSVIVVRSVTGSEILCRMAGKDYVVTISALSD